MAVAITAWRRPYYLEPVLMAWSRATGIERVSRFIIALGPTDRFTAQAALIERMRPRFRCPLEVRMQSYQAATGPSAHRAIGEMITGAFADEGTGFVVAGEEDVLPSSDVLEYMTWAAERFRGDPGVLCVLAHNQGGQGWDDDERPWPQRQPLQDADADQGAVRLLPYFNPWIWGIWRDRWEQAAEPAWDWDATLGDAPHRHGYDWRLQRHTVPAGGYVCVVPDASRSQNIGEHEGGYSHAEFFHLTQSSSFRAVRDEPEYRLAG